MSMWQIYPYDADNDLLGKRKYTSWLSAAFIVVSILVLALIGPRWGIDFQGGTEVIVEFDDEVQAEDVREAAQSLNLADPLVQRFGSEDDNQFMLQTSDVAVVGDQTKEELTGNLEDIEHHQATDTIDEQPDRMEVRFNEEVSQDAIREAVTATGVELIDIQETGQRDEHWYVLEFEDFQQHLQQGLSEQFGAQFDEAGGIQRLEAVGPRAGEQLRNDGMVAMLVALIAILIYIWFRFDIRYSPGAVAALAHDIVICLGLFVLVDIEFSLPIVAALLTIIGYSLNDTIVVFDRIRENLEAAGGDSVERVANTAINQTMSRTLITSLTTFAAVAAIAAIATGLIQDFALALVIGVVAGTYSSIFVASPVMLRMDKYLEERKKTEELLEEHEDEPDPSAQV